jgi:uncharacterized protein YbcV (DUF1398 family)
MIKKIEIVARNDDEITIVWEAYHNIMIKKRINVHKIEESIGKDVLKALKEKHSELFV